MIIQDDNVKELQGQIQGVMPLLTRNLELTYHAYMKDGFPHGAYVHVLQRHESAMILANIDQVEVKENTEPDQVFKAAAPLFIDLRTMAGDLTGRGKAEAEEKIANLLQLFRDNGFTEDHDLFKIPIKPPVERHVPA